MISVPVTDLEHIRDRAREATAPLIRWNESPQIMHDRANRSRIEALETIDDLLTATLQNNGRPRS